MGTKNQKVERLKQVVAAMGKDSRFKTDGDGQLVDIITEMSADVETIKTGSLVLDSILGGGFGRGRIVEVYGRESSGKTSIAISTAANVQREGGTAVYIDAENAFDPYYAASLGVNLEELFFSQPNSAEQALDLVSTLTESGEVDLIVVDSVAALVPQAELEGDAGDMTVGALARLMSKELRKLVSKARANNTTVIFINQTRDKIGGFSPFGTPQVTPGGQALKFYSSQRVEIKKGKPIKGDTAETKNKTIGTNIGLKIVKNKIAPPFAIGDTVITYAKGINMAAEMIEVGPSLGVINRPNNRRYETTKGELIGNSKLDAIERLEKDKKLFKAISKELAEKLAERKIGQESQHDSKANESDYGEESGE